MDKTFMSTNAEINVHEVSPVQLSATSKIVGSYVILRAGFSRIGLNQIEGNRIL